jgi:hypothetical protein
MRAGMDCLLRLLRDQPQQENVAESDWLDVLAIAAEENLLPWVAARLASIPDCLPASINSTVAEIRREAQREAFAWSAALKHLLAAFYQRQIPLISLKGPWLAERLYGDAALRSYSDLDFLVRPCDWDATERLLTDLGFSPCGPANERHRRWHSHGIQVEPHYRLEDPSHFDFDNDGVWQRACPSQFHGVPGLLLVPGDELKFLCVHAVRHCFERLSLLLDLSYAFRRLSPPDVLESAQRSPQFENAVRLCWLLAKRLEDNPPFPTKSQELFAERSQNIANRVWQRFLVKPAGTPQWRETHFLYLEMETRGWYRLRRRIRFARILLTRLTDHDFDFAARFRLRHVWQVWMLRHLRLLVEATRLSQLKTRNHRQSAVLHTSGSAN